MSDEALVTVVLPILVIVLPIIVIGHYITKWKAMRASTPSHEETEALRDLARRMEGRIANLENILDAQAPGWRSRSEPR